MSIIYTDAGASIGLRTRLFRDCANGRGVEWMYAVDWAAGHDRWFGFGMSEGQSIKKMMSDGWDLRVWQSPSNV